MTTLTLNQAVYSKPLATTKVQVEKAWTDGKDFQIMSGLPSQNGRYCSIRDTEHLKNSGIKKLNVADNVGGNLVVINL